MGLLNLSTHYWLQRNWIKVYTKNAPNIHDVTYMYVGSVSWVFIVYGFSSTTMPRSPGPVCTAREGLICFVKRISA